MRIKRLKKNRYYLLACSFGPDSMALFQMLLKQKYRFDVAFVNYHLRLESNQEEVDLINFCKENEVKLHIKQAYYDKANGKNIEAWCRDVRYSYFEELVKEIGYDGVLIAHNQDDLLETYLLQKERKNFVKIYGLKHKTIKNNVSYYRPLLEFPKRNLSQYCIDNLIPFSNDLTNESLIYKRNILRHTVLKNMSKNDKKALLKEIKEKNKVKNKENKKYMSYVLDKKIYLDKIKDLSSEEFTKLIYIYLVTYFGFIKKISHKFILDLYQKKDLNKNMKMKIENTDYYFFVEYGYITVDKLYDTDYMFIVTRRGNKYFQFILNNQNGASIFDKNQEVIVQNVRMGDKYTQEKFSKSTARFLLDSKVPQSIRRIWPAVYSLEGELLYIPKYQRNVIYTNKSLMIFNIESLKKLN